MRVLRRIGRYEVLWSLFAEGKTGLHVFRRISRHVTGENAGWWAQIVQTCTLRQIERLLDEADAAERRGKPEGQLSLGPDSSKPLTHS